MKNLLIISLLLVLGLNGFGQNERNLILQIDTLELNDCDIFSIGLSPTAFGNISMGIDKSNYIYNKDYPNFICPISLESDTSKIEIVIGDEGGHLILEQAYLLDSDTIRINKIRIIENCFRDTTFIRKDYYIKGEDGSIGEPYKVKYSQKITKDKCKNPVVTEELYVINGKRYKVTFEKKISLGIMITDYHGYPRKYEKDRKNYKGKVKYFHGSSESKHNINEGVITLGN